MQKTHNLKEHSLRVFLLSKVQFAPLLKREYFRAFLGHCFYRRICAAMLLSSFVSPQTTPMLLPGAFS